jgi:hypothetical protein
MTPLEALAQNHQREVGDTHGLRQRRGRDQVLELDQLLEPELGRSPADLAKA